MTDQVERERHRKPLNNTRRKLEKLICVICFTASSVFSATGICMLSSQFLY